MTTFENKLYNDYISLTSKQVKSKAVAAKNKEEQKVPLTFEIIIRFALQKNGFFAAQPAVRRNQGG